MLRVTNIDELNFPGESKTLTIRGEWDHSQWELNIQNICNPKKISLEELIQAEGVLCYCNDQGSWFILYHLIKMKKHAWIDFPKLLNTSVPYTSFDSTKKAIEHAIKQNNIMQFDSYNEFLFYYVLQMLRGGAK